jgi:hypothetical protein
MSLSRVIGILCAALLVATCATASGAVPGSGISGRVVEGPTCPVERVPPDPQCAPRPLAATLRVHRRGSRTGILVHSGTDGRFRVRLAAGTYVVQPLAQGRSPFPRPPGPLTVRVRTGHFTNITITYDTGIR